jgi:hypothetical protein
MPGLERKTVAQAAIGMAALGAVAYGAYMLANRNRHG